MLGSLNVDLVLEVPRPARPGETLAAGDLEVYPGGKGANQAVAAARLGAEVRMAGCVGRDEFAQVLLRSLDDAGVDRSAVECSDRATGVAVITVLPGGENSILISPGANAALTPTAAQRALSSISSGDFLLCQLETPRDTVAAALDFARTRGAVTMLDPAPAPSEALPAEMLSNVDYLTPNETETAALIGRGRLELSTREGLADAARALLEKGPRCVVLKLGSRGCFLAPRGQTGRLIVGFAVEAVDATAAGDTFNAALAARLAAGDALDEAATWANAAAAASVTRRGAQQSAPTLEQAAAIRGS